MYKGSNTEKLNSMSLYDLLCRMQKNAEKHHKSGAYACVIAYLEGESPIWRCAEFMENKRASCNKCIAAWLNEPYDGRWHNACKHLGKRQLHRNRASGRD